MTEDAASAGSDAGTPPDPERRRFLGLAAAGLGACAGAALLGATGVAVVVTPLTEVPSAPGWYDLGPLARFAPGSASKVSVTGERRDAWSRLGGRSVGRVLLLRPGEEPDLVAFSAVCPHNGCDVRPEGEGFLCPCHTSRFSREGVLISGESPRGLDPLEVRVEDGRVRVRLVRFEVGTSERRPIG